jgi:hypothetical protein
MKDEAKKGPAAGEIWARLRIRVHRGRGVQDLAGVHAAREPPLTHALSLSLSHTHANYRSLSHTHTLSRSLSRSLSSILSVWGVQDLAGVHAAHGLDARV